MKRRASLLLLFIAFAVNRGTAQSSTPATAPTGADLERTLSLPWNQFDQSEDSGWRPLAAHKRHLDAAKLIETYLARHTEVSDRQRALSRFHAGMQYVFQAREYGGDPRAGIPDLDQAIVSGTGAGLSADWNDLVRATKAFLLGDKATLIAIGKRVAAMPPDSVRWLKPPDSAEDLLSHVGEPYGSWWPKEDPKK